MSLRVHVAHDFGEEQRAAAETALPEIEFSYGDELPDGGVDVLVSGRPTDEQLDASDRLRAVVVPWAGIPTGTAERLQSRPHLALHNLHHNAAPTAEMAVALLLAAAKRVVPLDQALRRHDWTPRYQPTDAVLLDGATALVVGLGAIGRRVARACQGLGMDVLGTRVSAIEVRDEDGVEVHPADRLHDLLPRATAVILTLPLTDATRGLIGAPELALLPRPAVLVNIGRGPLIDAAALDAALADGTLHAAGLDVWWNYPREPEARTATAPADVPLERHDSLVLSPHRGGHVMDGERLRTAALIETLRAFVAGTDVPNPVDPHRGY